MCVLSSGSVLTSDQQALYPHPNIQGCLKPRRFRPPLSLCRAASGCSYTEMVDETLTGSPSGAGCRSFSSALGQGSLFLVCHRSQWGLANVCVNECVYSSRTVLASLCPW